MNTLVIILFLLCAIGLSAIAIVFAVNESYRQAIDPDYEPPTTGGPVELIYWGIIGSIFFLYMGGCSQ